MRASFTHGKQLATRLLWAVMLTILAVRFASADVYIIVRHGPVCRQLFLSSTVTDSVCPAQFAVQYPRRSPARYRS